MELVAGVMVFFFFIKGYVGTSVRKVINFIRVQV
jgi:hypothetical protein